MDFYIVKIGLEFARNYWILGIISCPIIEWTSLGNFMPCLGLFSSGSRIEAPPLFDRDYRARVFFEFFCMRRKNKRVSTWAYSLIRDRDRRWNLMILDSSSNSGSKRWDRTGLFWIRVSRENGGREGGGGGREEIFKEAWIDCTVSSKWKTINGTAGRSKNSLGGENCASLPTAVIIISISVPERLANENYKTDCLDFFLFPFLSFFPLPFPSFLKSKVYEKFLENSTTSLTINWNSVEKLFQKLKNKYPRKILRQEISRRIFEITLHDNWE